MCMRLEFMFLSMIILDPNIPSQNIDVCLWPLIDKLKQLWSFGALTYDVSRKNIFVSKVERDIALPLLSGEELYNMVLEYDDIMFGF